MPGLTLTLSGLPNPIRSRDLAQKLTDLTARLLDKEIARTMVLVRYLPAEDWYIAGRSLVEWGQNSFRLEVTITDETNTKAQKAAYQREAFALLSREIGNLHPHSNVHVIDCRGSAYGYGGVTQEQYYQQARLAGGLP